MPNMDRKPGQLTKSITQAVSSLQWVKVVGIGEPGVGKTCLIKHFCESKFSNGYQPTVGVDYGFKIQTINGVDMRVHLWDLSGHSEYLDVRNELYSGTDAVFLVYDVTQQNTFDSLEYWVREITKYMTGNPTLCLVANKTDLKSKRVITSTDGQRWANARSISYFETSCATGEGTEEMFDSLLESSTAKKSSKSGSHQI